MNILLGVVIFLTFTNLISLGWLVSDIGKKIDKLENKIDFLYGTFNEYFHKTLKE